MLPKKLLKKLDQRKEENALRALPNENNLIDFSSNDYLGFSKSEAIFKAAHEYLSNSKTPQNGASGSRLLSGNHSLYKQVENLLIDIHQAEAALIFNSGYDANIGFFSSVPQRGDVILYDEFIHASIRDGITMSNAKSYKFKHNDLVELEQKCQTERSRSSHDAVIYIVTESVFSMDGDTPDLKKFVTICKAYNCHLIVDEAHAVGVFGNGLIEQLDLQNDVFARVITFGKAMGCHGAAILGSEDLKSYLINFARSLIYTTGLPPHSLATILSSYNQLTHNDEPIIQLQENINFFKKEVEKSILKRHFIPSDSAIHCALVSGNDRVKKLATTLQNKGFDVKPILSPTVPKGQERIRICLHSFNTKEEIKSMLSLLADLIS
ncbi:aminotransferase class I/II-fold pyridoxal phosphate-dependent enzyme [Spongiivirga citrea]|uniref:Aminotransferase class I/II-fold pyridoxal phosphate-dependent enzyme n=1 Tax=Spongiivirga citrea TaxID=1481457 RepID=A0A6M0CGS3_9FLAO|nr:pyridoxal phosphate-dependent aminotransferase family protein [Spongiivirga citrea]NER17116.1 aminotransferase class I/II-fold pyridoxal phosphate-dependent enzyme [Spongiivirga citrea]